MSQHHSAFSGHYQNAPKILIALIAFQSKEELQLFTDAFPPQIPEFPQDRRSLIALEVYTTERTYVKGLELLVKVSQHCVF